MSRPLRLLVAFLAVLAVATPAHAEPNGFEEATGGAAQGPATFLYTWGATELEAPIGLAANAAGEVYVADSGHDRVVRTYPGGDVMRRWGAGRLDDPCGVAVESTGRVLVTDHGHDRVQRFTGRGRFLKAWGGPGTGNGRFDDPCGIAVDATGRVYVADTGNDRVQVFAPNGRYLASWGVSGSGPNGLLAPMGVAVGRDGQVYVADTGNHRVQVFSADGTPVRRFARVQASDEPATLQSPAGIAVDRSGRVYVTDALGRVQRYTVDGRPLSRWGSAGTGAGELDGPTGIVVSPQGRVVVADTGSDRLSYWGWSRPDALIAGPDGVAAGDGVYNTTGQHQTATARVRPGGTVEYVVTLTADGAWWPRLLLRGGASTRQVDVAYRARRADVTDQVVAGTFRTPFVTPTHPFRLRILVTPRPEAASGAVADRVLRASTTEGAGTDVVRFVTTVVA